MPFTTPTAQSVPAFAAQAVIDATDLAAILAATTGTGVISGCAVTPFNSGASLNVAVAAGAVVVAGASVTVAIAANVTVAVASANDRRDIVVVNAAGVVSTVAGTACTVSGWTTTSGVLAPVKPAIPALSVLLAEVYVPGSATAITASNLVAKAASAAAGTGGYTWTPTKTTAYSAVTGDAVPVDTTAAAVPITLPAGVANNLVRVALVAGGNLLTVNVAGAGTINGAATFAWSNLNGSYDFSCVSPGVWRIV